MFIKALRLTRGRKCMVIPLSDNPHGSLVEYYVRQNTPVADVRKELGNAMKQHRVGEKFRDMGPSHADWVRSLAFYAYLRDFDVGIKIERIVLTSS